MVVWSNCSGYSCSYSVLAEADLCVPRRHGGPILNYDGSIRRLLLQVNISNTPSAGQPAEDAHNTVLNVSIPPALIYSGVKAEVGYSGVQMMVKYYEVQTEVGFIGVQMEVKYYGGQAEVA